MDILDKTVDGKNAVVFIRTTKLLLTSRMLLIKKVKSSTLFKLFPTVICRDPSNPSL